MSSSGSRALVYPSRKRNCSTCNFFGEKLGWLLNHLLYDCSKGGMVTGIGRCNWWEMEQRQMELTLRWKRIMAEDARKIDYSSEKMPYPISRALRGAGYEPEKFLEIPWEDLTSITGIGEKAIIWIQGRRRNEDSNG